MRCTVGQEVGYSIRFEDVTSAKTRIKFLTDGLLLREALVDPLLSRYSVIMVDEAHERSLSSDLLLGILKKIRRKRPELRIVVSSATLDAESFLRFFSTSDDASNIDPAIGTVFHLGGRMYPVDVHYLAEPAENYIEKAIQTVFDIHTQESDGDILLFLTGREEIDTVMQEIADRLLDMQPQASRLLAVPLYAGLPTDQQMAVFEPSPTNTRKVVVATNIAEASVTISGIAYVIDCGFVKLRAYDPRTGIDTLTATPISRASATQRSGRAGRTKPGKCYRLYTEAAFSNLTATTIPEMQRSNLAPVILQLKALGIDNIARFDFPTAPPSELIIRALELLHALGALDSYAKLTRPLGTRMCDLALEPQMAKALLSAPTFSCLPELLSIAALTSLQSSIFITHDSSTSRPRFAATEGDALTMLNAFAASSAHNHATAWCHAHSLNAPLLRRAASIRAQLQRSLERAGVSVPATGPADGVAERIRRCLTAGFFAHAARMASDGSFRTVDGGVQMFVHPSSVLFVSCFLFVFLLCVSMSVEGIGVC